VDMLIYIDGGFGVGGNGLLACFLQLWKLVKAPFPRTMAPMRSDLMAETLRNVISI